MEFDKSGVVSSLWEAPGQRYTRFLKRVEASNLPKTLAILGCSDGTYVVPAAKRGFDVLAIDTDELALFGGVTNLAGNDVKVLGLEHRLEQIGLRDRVVIVQDDCFLYNRDRIFSAVFTSGSIHYQENSAYPLEYIVEKMQSYVAPGGLLLMEYVNRSEENNDPSRHFVTAEEVVRLFPDTEWNVTSNKKKSYVEAPNPRNEQVHNITWGRLYAEKKLS